MTNNPRSVEEITLERWADFEKALEELHRWKQEHDNDGRKLYKPKFRGVANSQWRLETTLERAFPMERSSNSMSFIEYYKSIDRTKPAVETLTAKTWEGVPSWYELNQALEKDFIWLNLFLLKYPRVYDYLIYLRHHGFPSPLLDWTDSAYVAAFFAFDHIPNNVPRIGIYALIQDEIHGGSGEGFLFMTGQYVRTHPRHYLQQSDYSMCVSMSLKEGSREFLFSPHDAPQTLSGALGMNGRILKYTIPSSERISALKHLDQMNINAYSLFASEDALVRTLARRECLFRK